MKAKKTNNQPRTISILELIEQKKKHTAQEKKLENMTWGMGLEHEAQFFYIPQRYDSVYTLDEIVAMATQLPATELLEWYGLKESDRELLEKIDFEMTGRKCGGKVVLDRLDFEYDGRTEPLRMPEFITDNPFSTLKNKKTIMNYFNQLLEKEKRYTDLMYKNPVVRKFVDKESLSIGQYPFGMCSNIRVRNDYSELSPELNKKHYQDYTGSFHFTITLPFEKKEKYSKSDEKKFVDKHYNFGALFQWIEPLLLAAYFSCDQKAVGTNEKRIRGSFRVARVGWGNFAGSDMRRRYEDVGVGRYADVEPYWRDDFKFYESDLTQECRTPHWQEDQAISSFSSNIRTFGPDPTQPGNTKARISGAKMTIPNGVELRIFDHFNTHSLLSLLQIIILIAANSETVKVKDYVYQDEEWKKNLQKIMLEGWKAEVSELYLKKLEKIFDIETKPKSMKAYDVLVEITLRLFEKNKDSDIVYLLYGKKMLPDIPMVNKYSWDFAFLLKIYSEEKVFKSYQDFVEDILNKKTVKEFKASVIKNFGKEWTNNWEDILYFMEGKYLISLIKNGEEFDINYKLLRDFVSKEAIQSEIIIQLNLEKFLTFSDQNNDIQGIKGLFFSYEEIKKRYKNFFNPYSWSLEVVRKKSKNT